MKIFIVVLSIFFCLIPKTASANEWCEIPYNQTEPECLNLEEPVIPVIGTPCNSDFEWSCRNNQVFLPGVMK
jgi:hypothetical protein